MSTPTEKAVIAAVYDNDTAALQRLLQTGADPNARDEKGRSAAMLAASSDLILLLRILIGAGADLQRQDARGCTVLDYAIVQNHLDVVRMLLEAGVDPNVENGAGFTALCFAAGENRLDALRMLLEAGADPNARCRVGNFALSSAAVSNQVDALRMLLEAGADPNARDSVGASALFSAALQNHIEAVRVLLGAGALPTPEEIVALGQKVDNLEIHYLIKDAIDNRLKKTLAQLPSRFAEQQQEPTGNSMSRTDMYDFLLRRDGTKCQGCGRVFDDPRYLEIDHIMPRSDGGSDHISNRVLLCGPCNRAKGNQYTLSGLRRLNKKNGWMVEN